MGNSCFGFKERLVGGLPTLLVIRAFMPHRRSKDYRVVVVGSAGVGKSALVQRWVRGTFREAYLPTIEDTYRQVLGCNHTPGALHITDTTGGHRYPGLQRLAIARGHAFVLVYSVTKKETLEELKPLYEQIREIKGNDLQKFPIVLVGNKIDESGRRQLALRDGAAYALEWNCTFVETSAKADINVRELFHTLLSHQRKADTCPEGPEKKSQMPKTTEKLLGKCIVM
ncbi:GTP-binding protein Di-Ras3 isoform X2 [Tupaia chinensis]|uniref:GTP-binding protein Di-Ras3 n=2 Tax=Tupaia chinensis TaxID=246437 RepID=L8Y8L8_TUPCH|nr:GTP-binding protein Di-Ras3 isoform X2 [Tupaia chinensis]ELV11320.1 GTP-binding protein Di-Ras3 [Tupaia chinensis]